MKCCKTQPLICDHKHHQQNLRYHHQSGNHLSSPLYLTTTIYPHSNSDNEYSKIPNQSTSNKPQCTQSSVCLNEKPLIFVNIIIYPIKERLNYLQLTTCNIYIYRQSRNRNKHSQIHIIPTLCSRLTYR